MTKHSVILKRIRYKNFLGSGNYWTEYNFEDARTQIVTGMNGSGKSSLIDALSYVLYGKPYRNDVNIPQLVNSITKKNMLVELILEVRSTIYLIRRGMEPRVFEIFDISNDNRLIDQRTGVYEYQNFLENQILKRKHKTFCQTVVLGSSNFIPFMKLVAKGRREVVDDLLDISVCSTMNDILKEKLGVIKVASSELASKICYHKEKINLQKQHIQQLKAIKGGTLKEQESKIIDVERNIRDLGAELILVSDKLSHAQNKLDNAVKKKEKDDYYNVLFEDLRKKKAALDKDLIFYNKNDHCPTCQQVITVDFKQDKVDSIYNNMSHVQKAMEELTSLLEGSKDRMLEVEYHTNSCREIQKEQWNIESQQNYLKTTLNSLQAELATMRQALEKDSPEAAISPLVAELSAMEAGAQEIQEQLGIANFAALLLKDGGIKARIIRQYVPILNTLINKYLEELDLFVGFTFDENFNEQFLSRYRDEFSYGLFSEGEKAKINIAILFAWLEVIHMRNSTSFNLLVLDEVLDGSMDQEGLDAAVRLFLGASNKTIMVISPKPQNWISKFEKVIKFQKVKNFSHMEITEDVVV